MGVSAIAAEIELVQNICKTLGISVLVHFGLIN